MQCCYLVMPREVDRRLRFLSLFLWLVRVYFLGAYLLCFEWEEHLSNSCHANVIFCSFLLANRCNVLMLLLCYAMWGRSNLKICLYFFDLAEYTFWGPFYFVSREKSVYTIHVRHTLIFVPFYCPTDAMLKRCYCVIPCEVDRTLRFLSLYSHFIRTKSRREKAFFCPQGSSCANNSLRLKFKIGRSRLQKFVQNSNGFFWKRMYYLFFSPLNLKEREREREREKGI